MNDDSNRIIRVNDDDERRQPKDFMILGAILAAVGGIWLRFDGAPGVGWLMVGGGALVLFYGIIAGAVRAGIQSARDDRPAD